MDSDRLSTATVIPRPPHHIGTSTGGVRAHKRTGYFSTLPLPSTTRHTSSPDLLTEPFVSVYYTYYIYSAKPRPTTANRGTYIYFLEFSAAGTYILYIVLTHLKRFVIVGIYIITSADCCGEVSTTFLETLYNIVSYIYIYCRRTITFSLELNIRIQDKHARVHTELLFD